VHSGDQYKSVEHKRDTIQSFIGFDRPHRSKMNTTLLLAALCALLAHQASGHSCASGSGNSCQAETRKKDCGGLVEEPHSGEQQQDVTPATVATPPPGECICTPAPGSGSGSGEFHSHCELIEAFYNISLILSGEQQVWCMNSCFRR
jgi:hypothetical protein